MGRKINSNKFNELSEINAIKTLKEIFHFEETEIIKGIEEIKKWHGQVIMKNDLSNVTMNCIYYDNGNLYTLWGMSR